MVVEGEAPADASGRPSVSERLPTRLNFQLCPLPPLEQNLGASYPLLDLLLY